MRTTLVILFAGLWVGAAFLNGCVPFLKSAKPQQGEERAAQVKPGQPGGTGSEKQSGLGPEEIDKLLPPPPPDYKPTPSSPAQSIDAVDFREKEEIKEAALKFAKEFTDVKHMKTCYSKEFGGWYLILYTQKGKKFAVQHFQWNHRTREFEPSAPTKLLLTKEDLEKQLPVSLSGETCYQLK